MTFPHRGFLPATVLLALLAGLVFLPGLPGDFLLDDIPNVVQNAGLHLQSLDPSAVLQAAFGSQPGSMTRVVPMLTFALDYYRAGGLDPGTFKATSIAIHVLTTLVMAWFLRDLLLVAGTNHVRARWVALALALAWALHPLQVSSVLYVVQRMQTLATLFVLLALWAYLKARQAQMEGRPGRTGWMLTGLLWVVALACKEDAVLVPAYLLALELTVLRFRAADAAFARKLQRGYLLATALGVAAYLLLFLPNFWSWETYPQRDFSSVERLLTEGRVLCMYLWQMVVPLPSHMPFFYDWLQPSRSLLAPWTTLPALLLLATLLVLTWRLRHRRPLFALGVLLFFAGHFITSNALSLELAFEHRNHFPMIGIVLAVGDLLMLAANRLKLRALPCAVACALLLAGLASATLYRAHAWGSGLTLAQTSTQLAPRSVRAWNFLCIEWYELGGGAKADNPYLDNAIAACSKAADLAPESVASLVNIIAFKSIQGTATATDWGRYLKRLRRVPLSDEHVNSMWTMIGMVREGIALDENGVLAAIDAICDRGTFPPPDDAAIGVFILGNTHQPDRAYPHFARAVQTTEDPAFAKGLIDYVRKEGHPEWADQLQAMMQAGN